MFSEQDQYRAIGFANLCQLLGIALYFATLFLPIGVTSRHVDEFGSTAYGVECSFAALVYIMNVTRNHLYAALTGWVNPLTLLCLLIGRIAHFSKLAPLQPYLVALVITDGEQVRILRLLRGARKWPASHAS